MINITHKKFLFRKATAKGLIKLKPETVKMIKEGRVEKGDPISMAKIAGILAAKNTSSLIPLCHPLPLTSVELSIGIADESTVEAEATVKTRAQTGVELEALTAVSIALLTVWDMTKQYEKDVRGQYPHTVIRDVRVVRKVKGEKQGFRGGL